MVVILSPLLQACCRIAEIFYLILALNVEKTAPCKSIVCHHGGRSGARTGGGPIRISGRRLRSVGVTNIWNIKNSYFRGLFVICNLNQQFYKKREYLFYYPSLNVAPSVKFVVNKKLVIPEKWRLVGLSLQFCRPVHELAMDEKQKTILT